MTSYLFDSGWQGERRRLAGLCHLYDCGTIDLLMQLPVAPGMRCLEVGAGTGTIAVWLARTVGPKGHVVATDIDPRFLEGLERENLEPRRSDLLTDPLETQAFDVIHVRALLMHLPERQRGLQKLVAALRPGGTLLIEDFIVQPGMSYPALVSFDRIMACVIAAFRRKGADPEHGMKLAAALKSSGLTAVDYAVRSPIIRGGTQGADFCRYAIHQLKPLLLTVGELTQRDLDEVLCALDSPDWFALAPLMAASWSTRDRDLSDRFVLESADRQREAG